MTEAVSRGHRSTALLTAIDPWLTTLFGRHAGRTRHNRDRRQYPATDPAVPFVIFCSRVYALSWVVAVGAFVATVAGSWWVGLWPEMGGNGQVSQWMPGTPAILVGFIALALAGIGKGMTVRAGSQYLRWRVRARRAAIERTLPGAVQYLSVLATGEEDLQTMIKRTADATGAYGEAARSFQLVYNRTALSGRLHQSLDSVARDLPSDTLTNVLLNLKEHAQTGEESLESYLQVESRLLAHEQKQVRTRDRNVLELLAELYVVLLVVPVLVAIIVTLFGAFTPWLDRPVRTPSGLVSLGEVIVMGSALLVTVSGIIMARTMAQLSPPGREHWRPPHVNDWRGQLADPATIGALMAPVGLVIAVCAWLWGVGPISAVLLGYSAWAIPIGIAGRKRARVGEAKDRAMQDFVHAVTGHVSLGRPFPEAVGHVAESTDLGRLEADVRSLSFMAQTTTHDRDVKQAALETFADRVGTPLARQTVGLLAGALEAGSDAETVFGAIETEVGRLYEERRARREAMTRYVLVGWTTALLVITIAIAVSTHVVTGFANLATVAAGDGVVLAGSTPGLTEQVGTQFYFVTQGTMLACGWFAGMARRGVDAALLHSGVLVLLAYVAFTGVGVL